MFADWEVKDTLGNALIDIKTVNWQLPNSSQVPKLGPQTTFTKIKNPVSETEIFLKLETVAGKNRTVIPVSTNLQLKLKGWCCIFQGISEN